jgi:magnesium chelatase family protein
MVTVCYRHKTHVLRAIDFHKRSVQSGGFRGGGSSMVAHVATVAFLGLEARAVECRSRLRAGCRSSWSSACLTKRWGRAASAVPCGACVDRLSLPPKRITVNLSPADLPKEGSHYDFRSLSALGGDGSGRYRNARRVRRVGELGLDGRLTPSPGVLLAAMHASAPLWG